VVVAVAPMAGLVGEVRVVVVAIAREVAVRAMGATASVVVGAEDEGKVIGVAADVAAVAMAEMAMAEVAAVAMAVLARAEVAAVAMAELAMAEVAAVAMGEMAKVVVAAATGAEVEGR